MTHGWSCCSWFLLAYSENPIHITITNLQIELNKVMKFWLPSVQLSGEKYLSFDFFSHFLPYVSTIKLYFGWGTFSSPSDFWFRGRDSGDNCPNTILTCTRKQLIDIMFRPIIRYWTYLFSLVWWLRRHNLYWIFHGIKWVHHDEADDVEDEQKQSRKQQPRQRPRKTKNRANGKNSHHPILSRIRITQ